MSDLPETETAPTGEQSEPGETVIISESGSLHKLELPADPTTKIPASTLRMEKQP